MSEHQPGRLRGVAAAALGALAFAVLLVAAYARQPTVTIKMDRDLPHEARGFYPIEHSEGRPYAWTHPQADISLPGLDRGVAWHWTTRAILWRPPGVPLPTVRVAADGVVLLERALGQDFEPLDVLVPRRAGKSGVTLTIETFPSFVPGGSDSRQLGIALESMSLEPAGGWPLPPRETLAGGVLATFALGLAWTATGLPSLWVLAAVMVAAVGQTWAITRGVAAYTPYPLHVAALAIGIGAGTWVVVRLIEAIRREPMSLAARGVAACSALVCYLKILILVHPSMPIGDGVFHAHRFEDVLSGHFYFTSLAPGNYAFPYPVLLYVFAAPFSFFARDTLAKVALLRIVVTAADGAAGALLYWMIVHTTANRMTAIGAVVWYHLVPMTAWIMTWGNLTNAFGQTLFVASLALIVGLPVEWRDRRTVVMLAALACAALLSHPSTCAILTLVLCVTAGLYAWRGSLSLQGAALGVGVAAGAAALAAFVLYYAWFPAVYVRELGRAAAESGTRIAATAPGSSITDRIASIPNMAGAYLGWPALVAAVIGAWRVRRDSGSPRLAWLLAGWVGTCVAFLAFGIVTPIQMRTHFAVFPAVALAAAFGWSWAWRGRLVLRVGAVVVMGMAVWTGVGWWIAMLG